MNILSKVFKLLKEQNNKIRTRLFITYFVILTIAISCISITSYYFSRKSIEQKVENASTDITSQIQKNLELNFEQIRNTLLIPYYNTEFLKGINRYDQMSDVEKSEFEQKYVRDFFSRSFYVPARKDLLNVYIFLKNGDLLYSSANVNSNMAEDTYKNSWYNMTLKKDGIVYFSGAYKDLLGGRDRMIFSASIMIKNMPDYSKYSTIKAEFSFDVIADICKDTSLGKGSRIVLVDDDGKVVFSTGSESVAGEFNRDILKKMNISKGTFWENADNIRYMITFNESRISGWKIISMIPENEIFDASVKIRNVTVLIVIIAFLITANISFIFASGITRPILKLYKSVEEVKQGNLNVRVDVEGNDEIGKIAANFNSMIEEINSLIKSKYIYRIKLRESELELLYSQINPHFLYNTLDSIRAMADFYGVDNIAVMVNSLADMFRYSIKDRHGFVTVEEEINHIDDYLTIQKMRFGDKIQYEINIEEPLMKEKMLKLVLQPIVENAIFHGLERKKGSGFIKIEGSGDEESMTFIITDNGIGMEEETLLKLRKILKESTEISSMESTGRSIGLINVHTRLVIYYGGSYGITIGSRLNEGTAVTIKIPRDKLSGMKTGIEEANDVQDIGS